MDLQNLVAELQRRRVFRAVIGYGVAAFAVLQIAEPIMHGLHWPDEVLTVIVVALAIGFPLVVALAWIFDVNAGKVERTPPAPGLRGARLALLLAGLGALAAAPGVVWFLLTRRPAPAAAAVGPSIAVLPLVNLSHDPEQEYFSDGVAEEILNALAQVEGLHVAGRTSSFSFKGKNEDLRSIGQKLGVATVLEGSVRKQGDKVRITAQLINVADGFHLWSQNFDRELKDIFAVQEEIARAVVAALQAHLLPGSKPAAPARPTQPEAYEAFLLGRHEMARLSRDGYRKAIAALERALQLDPGYAPAWASLGFSQYWSVQYDTTGPEQAALQHAAGRSANRAVELAPDLPEARAVRAMLRIALDWDWRGADEDMKKALAAGANADALLTQARWVLPGQGRLTEAIAAARRVVELDPLSGAGTGYLGSLLAYAGRNEEAIPVLERAIDLSPDASIRISDLAITLASMGRTQEALARAERITDPDWRVYSEAVVWQAAGRTADSGRALAEMEKKYADTMAFQIAEVHAARGDADGAFAWLKRARQQEDGGYVDLVLYPGLRPLHADPRWAQVLASINLPADLQIR